MKHSKHESLSKLSNYDIEEQNSSLRDEIKQLQNLLTGAKKIH